MISFRPHESFGELRAFKDAFHELLHILRGELFNQSASAGVVVSP